MPKKIKKIILRLSDILISKDLKPSVDKKIITLLKGTESLYYMKLQKEKVILYNKDNNFNIEFKSKNLDSTCNLLNTLL